MTTRVTRSELVERLRAAGCVFAEDEARLLTEHADGDRLERLVARRVAGEPLEHLLGVVEVDGLSLAVAPGVFVPRTRTALLVRETVRLARERPGSVVLELCCGIAPVATHVARHVPGARVLAAEIDESAAACARRNLGSAGEVLVGDLFDAVPDRWRGRIDVVAANAPYVPTDRIATMPPEARDHEPRAALDGGADGVDVHRRIAAGVGPWLGASGVVLVETSARQASSTADALVEAGLVPEVLRDDDLDATVVVARRPTLAGGSSHGPKAR